MEQLARPAADRMSESQNEICHSITPSMARLMSSSVITTSSNGRNVATIPFASIGSIESFLVAETKNSCTTCVEITPLPSCALRRSSARATRILSGSSWSLA